MGKFLDSTASIKREAGRKKKKQETPQPKQTTQSPSVSQNTQNVVNRMTQKYGGGSSGGSYGTRNTGNQTSSQRQNQRTYGQPEQPMRRNQAELQRQAAERRSRDSFEQDRSRVSQSRNSRMLDTARGTKPESITEYRAKQEAARRQRSGENNRVSRSAQRIANRALQNTPGVAKESLRQAVIGHGKTAADLTAATNSANLGYRADIKSRQFQEDIERRRGASTRTAQNAYRNLSRQQERSEQRLQNLTKNAKGLEKAYYGALESGIGMATDALIGAGTGQAGALTAMASRTYGATRGQAKKEGATENEDRLYSLAQGLKESGTELMFPGAGLAKRAYGRAGLSLAEKGANLLTRRLSGKTADIAHAGLKLAGGVGEENLEEIAGWGLDPLIKEFTYGRRTRQRDAKEVMERISGDLRSRIKSDEDAQSAAAYLSSPDFLEETKRSYIQEGMSENDAAEIAAKMRDYLAAGLSGDTEAMVALEDEVSKRIAKSKKLEWDAKELRDTIASTTLLTGVTGLPGTLTTTARGAGIRDALGDEGVRALANTAIDFEDEDLSYKGQAARDRIDSGKGLTATQVYDLAAGQAQQYATDRERAATSRAMASKALKDNDLVSPFSEDQDGNITDIGEATGRAYNEAADSAVRAIRNVSEANGKESLTDRELDKGRRAIAGFKTGVFTIDDANELNFSNGVVREAFKAETGIDLDQYIVTDKNGNVNISATNTATKNALFAMAADNLVQSAQAETVNWMDTAKGEVVTQVSRRMGSKGTLALQQALDDVDERDRASYMMTANAADMLYQTARNMGTEWSDVRETASRMFRNIPEDKLKAMYEAGLDDRLMAMDDARGQQIQIGEKVKLAKDNEAPMGQVLVETETPVKGTVLRTFSELADNLGVDIHLVDDLSTGTGNQANGQYINGNIYINVNSDFEQNMGYIFMHEVTHHLKLYAPEQYKDLENLVREKWFNYDASQMQSEIAKIIDLYERNGQKLTEDEALEEIIADAAHEFINDPNFARTVADENPSLAKAILNSIRNALRMLRRVLASGSIEDDTHMNSLFSQIGILDEAERLWLDAYTQAAANKAAIGVEELQDKSYEEGRQSVAENEEERGEQTYSLSEMPPIDDLDQTNSTVEDENGDMVAQFQEDGSVKFSISSFENSGRKIYTEYLEKQVKNGSLSRKEADDMLRELETVYGIAKEYADSGKYAPYTAWSYADVVTGENGKPVFSAIKKNSEYKMNIDFSTICKKRRTLDAVFREMINRGMFEKLDLNKDESAAMVVNINNLIRQHKFEAACALCFVEARRYRQQQTATTFRDMWNGLVESMYTGTNKAAYFNYGEDSTVEDVPNAIHTLDDSELDLTYLKKIANEKDDKGKKKQTAEAKAARLILSDPSQRKLMRVGDMMASTGFENMQVKNPELMKVYNSKKGTGGAKSSFGDVQYLNEILKPRSFGRKAAYAVSGVRIQSFSDYVPRMVFDYVQVIADLAAKHLPAHGYTKEPLFVYQFGLTGTKINMSLVPDVVADGEAPGLDKDGNYIWNEEGTFPYDVAMEVQKADGYKENCGTIAVGISDKQIMKMLADPTIQMVIPYHKSSLNPIVAAMTNVDRFENYEKFQTTKDENGNAVSKDFEWDKKLFRLSHDSKYKLLPKEQWGSVQDLVKEYADWCKSKNYTPKFEKFLYLDEEKTQINPGYYKLLEDFALLDNDGNFKPQDDVKMRFPTESDAFGSMKDLIAQGLSEDTELEEKRSNEIGEIVDEIDEMFNQGTLTEQSVTSEKLAARMSISEELDKPYMDAVNSGNMDAAQRLVDEAAKTAGFKPVHRYHGTMNAGFTVFDKAYAKVGGNSGAGFYFSTEKDDSANHYADVEGADNYFKWSELADRIHDAVSEGTWEGAPELGVESDDIETYEDAVDVAKRILNKNPGTFDVYLNYHNPYIRDGANSTNLYDMLTDEFDESTIDRADYEDDWEYDDAVWEARSEHVGEAIYSAVYGAYQDMENNYEILDMPTIDEVIRRISEYAFDGSLTWKEIEDAIISAGDVEVTNPNWTDSGYATPEFTRAIIENLGFDAIEDKEVSKKFGQLSREMMTDTEHIIVFKPEQIKLSDPVTYAEDGSVIPLSERFDPNNNDIRYSLPTQDSDGNILTDIQMEYFKNSQARDEQGKLQVVYHTTNNGGFTVFDPQYSDDRRSLFFASNFDVSQTYGGHGAGSRFVEERKPVVNTKNYASYEEFVQDFNELKKERRLYYLAPIVEALQIQVRRKSGNSIAYELGKRAEERFLNWLQEAEKGDVSDYVVSVGSTAFLRSELGKGENTADSYESFLDVLGRAMSESSNEVPWRQRRKYPQGYYQCYLNLENPLIVDAQGHNWNDIPYGSEFDPNEWDDYIENLQEKYETAVSYVKIGQDEYDDDGNPSMIWIDVGLVKKDPDGNWIEDAYVDQVYINLEDYIEDGVVNASEASYALWDAANDSLSHAGLPNNYINMLEADEINWDGDVDYTAPDWDYIDAANDTYEKTSDFEESETTTYRTRELAEIAEEQGYDGVIIRDCVDIGGTSKLKIGASSMSDIFIAFSSNQVKDTRNENPSENADIRYSIPDEDEIIEYLTETADNMDDMFYTDPILEEGRRRLGKAKADFIFSKSNKWNQRWLTEGLVLDEKKTKRAVREAVMNVMSKAEGEAKYKSELVDEAMKTCKKAFYLMKTGRFSEAGEIIYDLSRNMVENNNFFDDAYEETFNDYVELRNYIRARKFYVPDLGAQEYAEHRKMDMGKIWLCSERKGTSIDEEWPDLCKNFPQWFSIDEAKPTEMLFAMENALAAAEPVAKAYCSEEAADYIDSLASQLYDIVYEGEEYRSIADVYKASAEQKTAAMKQRFVEAMRSLQTANEEHIAEIRELKEDHRAEIKELKARNRQDLKTQKMKYEYEIAELKQNREYNIQRLKAEKVRAVKEERQKNRERRAEERSNRIHRELLNRITDRYNTLCKWVLDPTKEQNVPEEFRVALAEFLQTLDLQTYNSKALEEKTGHVAYKTFRMRELKDRLNSLAESKTDVDGNYSPGIFEVDAYVGYLMESLSNKLDGKPVDALDNEAVKDIDTIMKSIIRNIQRYKEVKLETKNAELSDIGSRAAEFFIEKRNRDGLYGKHKGALGALETINATALTPAYLFDRMGPFKEMYDVLRHNGFDTYIRNEKVITDKLRDILSPYYTAVKSDKKRKRPVPGSEIEKWRDDRSAQTIELSDGNTVTMTVAQMMSLYCLSKRGDQALGHMCVGGILVTPIQTGSKIEAAKERIKRKADTSEKRVLARSDVDAIIAKLTPDQKKVADQLQELMSVDMAELGNEAHRELYGYDMFNESNYFPIKVHGNERATDINTIGEVFERIKSFGFTKPLTPQANKAIEIDDIFSVVADHCNGMNLYNAYLVPITDFMKVLNYTHTAENGEVITMKEAIGQVYGKDILKYILNMMKDINGIRADNRGGLEGIMNSALGTAKKTAVFGNIRVALQQPTAVVRAFAEVNPKYFMPLTDVKLADMSVYDEMYKYCPIAQWKNWGYYDTYMGRDIEDVMMNNYSMSDVALSGLYGALDNMTWSAIWQAVKSEQMDLHEEMDYNSEEFLKLCGRRASEVFDKTQVVDSTFHRSDAMRSKQVATKAFTAFMAEPTLTLNVFRAGLYNFREEMKAGNKGKAYKILGTTLGVIAAQAAIVSAAQAVADAWRGKDPGLPWGDDDDDDKDKEVTYGERFYHNLVQNIFNQLHLENNMYLVKDVTPYINYMISKGADYWNWDPTLRAIMGWDQDYLYSQNNLIFAGLENTANGIEQVFKKLQKGDDYVDYKTKEPKKWYDIIQKTMSGVGTFTGIPIGTLMRDFHPIWDKLFEGAFAMDEEEMPKAGKLLDSGSGSGSTSSGDTETGSSEGTSSTESDSGTYSKEKPFFGLGKSEYEKHQEELEKERQAAEKKRYDKVDSIREKTADLEGLEKDKKVWSAVTKYMKDEEHNGRSIKEYIAEGDFYTIDELKTMYIQAGGDTDYFNERMIANCKSELKKTISSDNTEEQVQAQQKIKEYMLNSGVTEAELSEIAYNSRTKTELKVAFRINDHDAIVDEMTALFEAGITEEDIYRIYDNRNKGLDLKKYKESGGKYADRLKSTGVYNWPINGSITSRFGHRSSPGGVGSTYHQGLDIAGSMGDPIAASDGGTVVYVGWYGGAGKTVMIEHDDGTVTQYSHMSWYDAKEGDIVAQGQYIGKVGSTGNSTGPHLHFAVKVNGEYQDPLGYLNKNS